MARPKQPREHGTRKGYRQHLYDNTEPCEPCRTIETEYQAVTRATRMAEGRYKRYYVPVPPSVKLKLDPAMVEAWLKDDDVADEELRLKLKEGLKAFKAANGTKVMADCRKAWRAATAA